MSTASPTPTAPLSTTPSAEVAVRRHPVRRATLLAGAVAAAGTTAVAAVADAGGVPLAIDGETIPLLGFAQLTLIGAVLGGLMAAVLNRWSARSRQWFVGATVVLTALSCIPSVAMPPDVATKVVLVATHVLAAAIIVPVIARQTSR